MTRPEVRLGGLLGTALAANLAGRLSHFITDETSPAIALFDPARADCNHQGDWYGEHAGGEIPLPTATMSKPISISLLAVELPLTMLSPPVQTCALNISKCEKKSR